MIVLNPQTGKKSLYGKRRECICRRCAEIRYGVPIIVQQSEQLDQRIMTSIEAPLTRIVSIIAFLVLDYVERYLIWVSNGGKVSLKNVSTFMR